MEKGDDRWLKLEERSSNVIGPCTGILVPIIFLFMTVPIALFELPMFWCCSALPVKWIGMSIGRDEHLEGTAQGLLLFVFDSLRFRCNQQNRPRPPDQYGALACRLPYLCIKVANNFGGRPAPIMEIPAWQSGLSVHFKTPLPQQIECCVVVFDQFVSPGNGFSDFAEHGLKRLWDSSVVGSILPAACASAKPFFRQQQTG